MTDGLGRMQNIGRLSPEAQNQREVLTRGLWMAVWLIRRVNMEVPKANLGLTLAEEVERGLATLESLLEPGKDGGGEKPESPR